MAMRVKAVKARGQLITTATRNDSFGWLRQVQRAHLQTALSHFQRSAVQAVFDAAMAPARKSLSVSDP
jgi:hypothetical protein